MLNSNFRSRSKFSNREYVMTYTMCYNMCTQRSPYNYSEQLYVKHGEVIEEYLQQTVLPAISSQQEGFILQELCHRWTNHKVMNHWMRKFFMYLDRYYVVHENLPSLEVAGLEKFKSIVYERIKTRVVEAVLHEVNREREGQIIDQQLPRSCTELFEDMGMNTLDVYMEDFEQELLRSSRTFYQRTAADWVERESTPDYLKRAEAALEEESKRVETYLNKSTRHSLISVVEEELLANQEMALLEKEGSGCRKLLENECHEDLSRMYRLFSKIDGGLAPMANLVKLHIRDQGMEIVAARLTRIQDAASRQKKDTNQDPQFVDGLLELHDRYSTLVNEQFQQNSDFQKALKDALQEVVNNDTGSYSNADLLSSYCDRILKVGSARLTDEQVEEKLQKLVQLFGYLVNKDLFAQIYNNQLAKRLLDKRSASDDWERLMIGKLKIACGAQFTTKMEGMLNDLTIGLESKAHFADHVDRVYVDGVYQGPAAGAPDSGASASWPQRRPDIEFSTQVLTTGHWPSPVVIDPQLPEIMRGCVSMFEAYYTETASHKRLKWVHSLGTVAMTCKYPDGEGGRLKSYEAGMTTFQAIALLLFNSRDAMTVQEIHTSLGGENGVEKDQLKRVIHSLAMGRTRLLSKSMRGSDPKAAKKIRDDDVISVNDSFRSPKRRFAVAMPPLEQTHNPKVVEFDRKHNIDAAIVRIMKARKTMEHQALMAEVLSQLVLFRPEPRFIKRRIEDLMQREFLARDPNQPSLYHYKA